MTQFYVYVHMDENLNPFYIGKGSKHRAWDFEGRNPYHAAKLAKHKPIIEVFCCKTESEAFMREQLTINALRLKGVALCNMTDGGEGFSGGRHSEKSRKLIGAASRGRIFSVEARTKMSCAKIGKSFTSAHRQNISKAKSGRVYSQKELEARTGSNNVMFGKTHSIETRLKISKAVAGVSKVPMSDDTKKRISESCKGRVNSEEAKAKMKLYRWIVSKAQGARKIHIDKLQECLANGWQLGKKLKAT